MGSPQPATRNPQPVIRSPRERSLWLLLALLAAALRLGGLGTAPLSSDEAVQALAAYQTAHEGGIPPEAPGASPLLFHANVLLFALFSGGDGLARLVPALGGMGLALTPLLFRRYLGSWGALGSGLMLALSPTLLALSRTLDGSLPAALGVMLLVGAVARYLDTWRPGWIPLGGVGLALALTAGPAAWGLLLGLALALAAGLWTWREQMAWYWPMIRPALGRGLVAFGLGLFAFGTALGLHPPGLAATGEQFIRWLYPGPEDRIPSMLPVLLADPLILVAGTAGAGLALSRRHGMGLLWLFWTLVGIGQWGLSRGGISPVVGLVPLAGLGGIAVEALARALPRHLQGAHPWAYGALSLTLWTHSGLILARYARHGQPAELLLVGIGVALQALLILLVGVALAVPQGDETPEEAARRALFSALHLAALVLGTVLLAVTFAAGWRVAQVCPGEPACAPGGVPAPTAPDLRRLPEEIARVADWSRARGAGEQEEQISEPLLLVDPDPAVAWALREFRPSILPEDALAGLLEGGTRPLFVVTPARVTELPGYYGTVFTLRRVWAPPESRSGWVRWWLYRESPSPSPPTDRVILWVREDLRLTGSGPEEQTIPNP